MGSRIHELRVCYPIKYSWFPARHNSGRGPPEPSALLFSKRAVHPWPTPRPLRPPPPRRRCAAATTPAAPRARAAGAASASLASRAGSHVPSSHDCCRSRCASVDVLAGIACAPAGWSCAGTFASSALSATGASGLFRSLLLQSRCLEAAIFATDLRLRLRRLSARRLPSLGPDPAALAHPVEVPRGYAVACVCGYRTFGYRCCTRILIGCFRSPNQLPDGAPA